MRAWCVRAAWAVAWTATATSVGASGLQVSPIGLRLAPTAPADALWLTNTGSDVIHAQVRVFRWTQAADKDLLDASRDLVVSPPMVTIAPGDRQMVRVIRQIEPPPDGIETAYRVIVDELPVGDGDRPGLTFVLRYSIPVFLTPAGNVAVKASLIAAWETMPDGPSLRIRNDGNGHAQVADVGWRDDRGHVDTRLPGLLGYALPGTTMRWKLPAGVAPGTGAVRARINSESAASTLPMGAGGR